MFHLNVSKDLPLNEVRLQHASHPFALLNSSLVLRCYEDLSLASKRILVSDTISSKLSMHEDTLISLKTIAPSHIHAELLVFENLDYDTYPLACLPIEQESLNNAIRRQCSDIPITKGRVLIVLLGGRPTFLKVTETIPNNVDVLISSSTRCSWITVPPLEDVFAKNLIIYTNEYDRSISWIRNYMSCYSFIQKWNLNSSLGCIVWGRSGVGKTYLVRQIMRELSIKTFWVNANLISVRQLKRLYRRAAQEGEACCIVLDHFELLEGADQEDDNSQSDTPYTVLYKCLTDIPPDQQLITVVIVKKLATLPSKLREALALHVELQLPHRQQRYTIFKAMAGDVDTDEDDILRELATMTTRYTVKELRQLWIRGELMLDESHDVEGASLEQQMIRLSFSRPPRTLSLCNQLKKLLLSDSRALSTKEVFYEVSVPTLRLADVAGYLELKKRLEEIVIWPLTQRHHYQRLGLSLPSGVLLHGPPGCGKTRLVHALAGECSQIHFLSIKGSELFSKYFGETEKNIRDLFAHARNFSPCILFLDEVEVLGAKRDFCGTPGMGSDDGGLQERVLGQLLNEMDGIQEKRQVFLIACTSRINQIDSAMLRPGRFDQLVEVPLPSFEDRYELMRWFSNKTAMTSSVNLKDWATLTQGLSGAAIDMLIREAALLALHENPNAAEIDQPHLHKAFSAMRYHTKLTKVKIP